jgi:tRNA-binding protein
MISYSDFEKLDIRTGTIIKANPFPKALKPAYQLTIDFGDLGIKKCSAQITQRYSTDSLIGMQVVAVINFPPKQIADFISECLVLGVMGEHNDITLLSPATQTKNGLKIS